ncbi:putative RNA-binding protein CP33, chloroplastic [Blattamonas nauphoetae]|uniref:RNA-binding protein CP33, chloroplastic n=1 Tax=Blattamonas nauphoetae TaxID=2049346 RepID=A0ABQ9XBY5_9EUKA|nr:putative RNA-binding protein CP33, chloroplastic [Blattamonas nauphoetae]
MTRLYIGNLSFSTSAKTLGETFEKVGAVTNVSIKSRNDHSLGFGFIDMATDADAKKAVDEINGKEIDGRTIRVEIARPLVERKPGERPPRGRGPRRGRGRGAPRPRRERRPVDPNAPLSKTRVHLGNLPFSITEEQLKAAFPGCPVKEVKIVTSFNGRPRGYGFVDFTTQEAQQAALKIGENLTLSDRQIHIAIAREQTAPRN